MTEKSPGTFCYDYKDHWHDYAKLSFRYGNTLVNPADSDTILLQQVGEHFEQIRRQPALERQYDEVITQSGLKRVATQHRIRSTTDGTRYTHSDVLTGKAWKVPS